MTEENMTEENAKGNNNQDNNKEENKKKPYLTKTNLLLRIIISGYLLYLGYELLMPIINGTSTEGTNEIIIIGAVVVFTAVAIPLGIHSVITLVKKNYVD